MATEGGTPLAKSARISVSGRISVRGLVCKPHRGLLPSATWPGPARSPPASPRSPRRPRRPGSPISPRSEIWWGKRPRTAPCTAEGVPLQLRH